MTVKGHVPKTQQQKSNKFSKKSSIPDLLLIFVTFRWDKFVKTKDISYMDISIYTLMN
jgi:hypothetical protein